MKNLAIIGSGDLGRQIAHFAAMCGLYEVIGFYDDFKETNEVVSGLQVLGNIANVLEHYEAGMFDEILIGIGYKHLAFKKKLYNEFSDKVPFATIIHSSCHVDDTAEICSGTVLYPGCIIDQRVKIGHNNLLNLGCCIAHDSVIGPHSFLSPSVTIAGFVKIGEQCNIGINATVIDDVKIANQVQLGGGAVVIKDLHKNGLYVGNPSRYIR